MDYRWVGALDVSVVGLGCNNFGRHLDRARSARVVRAALEAGINFFDTADVYYGVDGTSEEHLGSALKGCRAEAFVATKFGNAHPQGDTPWGGASPAWIEKAVDASLRRLEMDHIDLYQLHVPDPRVPVAETLGALTNLKAKGKVREVGFCNFTVDDMLAAESAAKSAGGARFVSAQFEWNVLSGEEGNSLRQAAGRLGVGVLPYFPLASGLLTGKYLDRVQPSSAWRLGKIPNRDRWLNQANLGKAHRLRDYASSQGRSLTELAFSWLTAHPEVASVIAGATSSEQVRENAAAADWSMTAEERAVVAALAGDAHSRRDD